MSRLRFAPSPTGYLHIGGVRTALFNFLYARNQGGTFLLRIEDTDRERSRPEYETEILESLRWLGLTWEEPVFRQSERLAVYREWARELVRQGKAYEVTEDGRTAVKFKMPAIQAVFQDLIHGPVTFNTELFGDLVILKSDGYPTYHWACVIDDHETEITHVIRGDDHLSNTPRQILLFEALGWKPPKYGHLPLIAGPDGTPLSKRHGAVALSHFRAEGYLPEGILNSLALLGWSGSGSQEFYTLPDLIKKFSLKAIHKSNAKFSLEKMTWLNGEHLKKLPEEEYLKRLAAYDPDAPRGFAPEVWRAAALLYRTRLQTLKELREKGACLFADPAISDTETKKYFQENPELPKYLEMWLDGVRSLDPFTAAAAETLTRSVAERAGAPASALIHPLRFALTGSTVSPGLFELMAVLGRPVCMVRVERFLESGKP